MADDDNATRAPESDAQEDQEITAAEMSGIPGDTVPDQGASMGEHCTTDRPTPSGAKPTGELTKIADIETYISKPHSYPTQPAKLLLLLTSGTGIHSTNNQLQADAFASEGYLVIMPDQFNSDPAPSTTHTTPATDPSPSVIEQIKMGFVDAAKSFRIDMWLARHTAQSVLPILNSFLDAAEAEFADCVSYGQGVYAAGYCFGGKYVLLLAGEMGGDVAAGQNEPGKEEEGMVRRGPRVKAGVCAHGTMVSREDFQGIKSPVGIVAVKDDPLFPDEVREQGVQSLKDKGVQCQQWVHSDVPHGFAVVGEYEDQKIQDAQKEAFKQMLGFLNEH
ncbi:hypothetical protein MBLNU457_2243t1 [Dothideomycetes sp. NU457]